MSRLETGVAEEGRFGGRSSAVEQIARYYQRDEDGRYVLRLPIADGELSATQAKEIAYVAYQFGNGAIALTARASIQLAGLEPQGVPSAVGRLEEVGLATRATGERHFRTIFGDPLSGVAADEIIDTRRLCHEVAAVFLASWVYTDLPRKFNIVFCGSPRANLTHWTQDVALLAAHGPDGAPAFQVLLGGRHGATPQLAQQLPVLVAPERCVEFVRALLDLVRSQGVRGKQEENRFCYLVERIGTEGILDWLTEHFDAPLATCDTMLAGPCEPDEYRGWRAQKQQGRWTMCVPVPGGQLSWSQLENLAIIAKRWGSGQLRHTSDHGLAIIDVPTGFKDSVATALARYGLSPVDRLARAVS